jgi:hypothetical protein
VELPEHATVADALNEARAAANRNDIPWDSAPLGIFGQPCERTDVPKEGDRIEIHRPLASDPRERRRRQVQSQRRASRR